MPDLAPPLRIEPSLAITLEEALLLMLYRLLPVPCHTMPLLTSPYLAVPNQSLAHPTCPCRNTRRDTCGNVLSTIASSSPHQTMPVHDIPRRALAQPAGFNTRRRTISNPLSAVKPSPLQAPPSPSVPSPTSA